MGHIRRSGPAREQALLVDLDDTLSDHRRSYLAGLEAVRARFPGFRSLPRRTASRRYRELLEEVHPAVVRGEISEAAGRRARFRTLLEEAGLHPSGTQVDEAVRVARGAYLAQQGTVRGARSLLRILRPTWVIIVVSNHLQREQLRKLRDLRLAAEVDGLVTSELVGESKPDPLPFTRALEMAGVPARAAVMLGDSWATDVVGAWAAGIRPVWLNRYRLPAPHSGVTEIPALVPVQRAVAAIVGGRAPPS